MNLRQKAIVRCGQRRADSAKKLKLADERGENLLDEDYAGLQSVDQMPEQMVAGLAFQMSR